MKEMRGIIETYVLNHDRNKRLLALFLALAILVSFAVPASLIQPANSLTANDGSVATPLSNTEQIETSTEVSKPAAGNYRGEKFFEEACTYIPKGADDLESFINSVSVTYGGNTYTADSNNSIKIDAGSNDPAEFKLSFSYVLNSSFIQNNLSVDEPCVYYVLPEGFEANSDMYGYTMTIIDTDYSPTNPAAYYSIDKETGLIVIQFTDKYIEYIESKNGATGTLQLNGKMNRADTADGDSTINVGKFEIEAEFDDKPNGVTKSQGVVKANANGGADITWVVTVQNAGYGFKGWSVKDENFKGTNVTVEPNGNFGSFNGDTFTFTDEPGDNVSEVKFTYTKHLTVDEVNALYAENNTAVKNRVDITNEDGLTNSAENTAWIEKPSLEKTGTPDYANGGSYGNAINWEIKVVHPYGGSLNGYVVSDTFMAGSTVTVTDVDGNVLTKGTDYIHNGDTNLTLQTDKSQVVISYTTTNASVQSYTNNAVLKKNDITFDSDSETVNYENATNLSKKGVYDPENNRIVWIVTATSHIGFLNDYKVHDYSAFGSSLYIDSLDDIDIISVSGKEKDGTSSVDLTLSGGNYVDASGNIYGTVTYESDGSNGYIYIDSGENNYGITNVEFSFSQDLGDTIAQSYSNNVQDDDGNNDTAQVTPSCQYEIDKSGEYNAQSGTIDWKISVKNNTNLDTASLNDVVLKDSALVGMSASDLSLYSALSTGGEYNYNIQSSGNTATVKDSNGNSVATLTIDSENGTITFSDVAPGFNYCCLKYTKAVDETIIKQAASDNNTNVKNTLNADVPGDDPNPKETSVKITNTYKVKKSGSYVASTGNIVWTVEVENTSGTLGGVELTDDAFGNLASGTSIEIESVNGYNDWGTITSTSDGNNFTFANSSNTSFGSMTLSGGKITFADSEDGKGVRYVKFTYQTKATAADGQNETNTISSNKVDDVTSEVTVSNPYTMSKSAYGQYDPETGLLTWQVTISNGTNSKDTLDGVVLYDEAFKNLVGDITFVSAKYDYLGSNLYGKSEDGVLHVYCSDWYDGAQNNEFGTLTVNANDGTLTFKDNSGSRGLHEVTFTYQTKATAAEIANGSATNTIGTHGTGVGPSQPSSATQPVTNRDVLFSKVCKTESETFYGDKDTNYTPQWEINIRKDDGYSTQTPILVDVLSADNGGKHYITQSQIGQIQILAKEYESGDYVTLDSQYYQVTGENAVTDDNGNTLGYSQFSVTFTNDVDVAHYRYLQIVYNTTADISGVVGENSGTTAHFGNSATFNGDKHGDDSFEYTEIPENYVETIGLTVKKTWSDSNNIADKRQDITFILQQKIGDNGEWTDYDGNGDGNADEFTISMVDGQDSWSLVINDLPKTTSNADGLENIYYRVREISSIEGYKTTYNNNNGVNTNGAAIEIINTLVSVEVEKSWVNYDPAKELSSVEVKLQYSADNGATWADYENGSATLSTENSWKYKWTALNPDYVYRVVEESEIDGFATTYSADHIDGVNNQYFKITNTSNNIEVKKHWVGQSTQGATVTLYKLESDGTKTAVGEPKTLDGSDWQTLTWYELDPSATYYVEESTLDGYATVYSKVDQTVTVGQTLTITNTLVSVEVEKVWSGYQNGTTLPDVTVKLQYRDKNDENAEWADYQDESGNAYTATLTSGSLKYTWTALNPDYVYRVVEVSKIDGFTTTYSDNYIDGVNNQYFKITNTSNNITVEKQWDDGSASDRPTDVKVSLYKIVDGAEVLVSAQTLTGSNWQTLTWYGLSDEFEYIVKEDSIDGYVTVYKINNVESQNPKIGDKVNITNTKNNIVIKKNWQDYSGNNTTTDIESIKLDVYRTTKGVAAISQTVADDDRHQYYDDENKPSHCEYKLCDLKAGDTITLRINSSYGYIGYFNGCFGGSNSAGEWIQEGWNGTVSDYYIELTFDITQDLSNVVLQTWYNNHDQNNSSEHVTSVEYSIQRWEKVDTITVTPDDNGNWTYNLSNLATATSPGEYIYKVIEQDIDGYYAFYNNNDGVTPTSNTTITVTNKPADTVKKTAYDSDGNAIASNSVISPKDLTTATIDGKECYVIKYSLEPKGSATELTDALPQGWTLCESDPYKPTATWSNNWTGTLNKGSGNEYYTYSDDSLYIKYNSAVKIEYYICIEKATLDEKIESTNSVLIENTVVSKSDSAQSTTNKIIVTNQTSGGTDDSLIEKKAIYLGGSIFTYQVVFNPEGKNLANGDFVDIYDDFDIVDYITNNSSISADELAKMDVNLTSIKFEKLLGYEYKDDGIGGIYLDYTADETVNLNTSYHVDYKPYETVETDLEFSKSVDNEYNVWTATSGYKVGDVITFVIDASEKSSSNRDNNLGPWLRKYTTDQWGNISYSELSLYNIATYDENTKQWTYTFTVDQEYSSLEIRSHDIDYNWGQYYHDYVTDVSAKAVRTTQLSTATLSMTVPDETPIVITYAYSVSGTKTGDTIKLNNNISFDTGNYNASDSADEKEFTIIESTGTITANTVPSIKKVSISDYSVTVAATFKMAYYDETYKCWVFAVDQTVGDNGNTVTPVWEKDDGTVAHITDNTIPSNAFTFELGKIDINLESGKLYKLIETSMPFGYQGYDLAVDFNENYLNAENSQYQDYINKVRESMNAAGRKSAVFEDLLQGYLAGCDSPYSAFFSEFQAVYYFAYQDSNYAAPNGFSENVTTVSTTGELILNNSKMIEISIAKTWDETALEQIGEDAEVKSIVELYWSYVKKSTGFPEQLNKVEKDSFSSLLDTDFVNPQEVGTEDTAAWGLLPSGYQGKPIYYYVKEIGYRIGDNTYYYLEDAEDYVLGTRDENGKVTPTLDENGGYQTVGIKPIYTGNGTNNNPNWTDGNENEQVTINIQNTAGIKINKVWTTSDNKPLENPPLDSVPISLYGIRSDTGVKELIGEFTVSAANNWTCIVDRDKYDLDDYTSFTAVENVPAEQRHLIYGFTISVGYNINGSSGTITVTNKDNTPTSVDVTVNKKWSDSADHSGHSVNVSLYKTTTPQPTEGVDETGGTLVEEVTLNAENSWSHKWEKLDYKDSESGLRYYYYVIETAVSGSTQTYKASYSRSDLASQQTITVTNYVPGSITIEKSWIDTNKVTIPNDSKLLPDSIEVDVYRRPDVDMIGSGGKTLPSGLKIMANGDSITQGTFQGYVSEDKTYPAVLQTLLGDGVSVYKVAQDGRKINEIKQAYSSSEYATSADVVILLAGTNDLLNSNDSMETMQSNMKSLIDAVYEKSGTDTVIFVCSVPRIKALDWWQRQGYNISNFNNDTDACQAKSDELVNDYNLMLQNLVATYTGENKPVYVDIKTSVGDNLADGCHPNAKGYEAIAETLASAINTYYGVGTTETPKNIDDIPENITDETKYEHVGTYELLKSADWQLSIELPTMNEENDNYVYYVVEKTTGYTVKYSANGQIIDNDGDKISLENTVDTEKTSITVNKTWVDDDSTDRPTSIQLKLMQKLESATEWTQIGEKITITADENWQTTITDLEVSDLNGEKYCYQVVEDVPSGYIVTYGNTNGNAAQTSAITIEVVNTKSFDLTVKKLWADENHVLNEGVTIEIYRDIVENTGGNGLEIMPLQLALVSPENGEITVTNGKTAQVTVNKDIQSVTFSKDLATAEFDGKTITITAGQAPGDTVMTVTDNDGQKVTVNITITDKPTLSLTLTPSEIETGKTSTISAQLSDGTSTAGITYEITEGTAATLSGNILTGVDKGEVTVKGTLTIDGDIYEAEATLKVTLPSEFTISATATEVSVGSTVQVTPSPGYGTFTYTSSDDSIATVDENGTVTGVGAGDVTITATRSDGKTAEVDIKVINADIFENENVVVRVAVGESVTITSATTINAYDGWNNEQIVKIAVSDGKMMLTGVAVGEKRITAKGDNWSKTATFTVIVYEKFSVSPDEATLEYGGSVTLTPNMTGDIVYTVTQGSDLVEISGNTVTAKNTSGTAVITATNTSTNETATVAITVVEEILQDVVSFDSNTTDVSYDSEKTIESVSLQLNHTAGQWEFIVISFDGDNCAKVGYNSNVFTIEEGNSKLTDFAYDLNASDGIITFTFNEGYQPSKITLSNHQNNPSGKLTITYASSTPAAASYSLRTLAAYAGGLTEQGGGTQYPELVKTIKLTSSDNWAQVLNLPVYDSNGNPYYYWIKEVGANGFTPSYSFSDGDDTPIESDYCINAANPSKAVATVKNTPNDTATSLPSTGGKGTQRYYTVGIGLMLIAFAGIYGFKRRQDCQS